MEKESDEENDDCGEEIEVRFQPTDSATPSLEPRALVVAPSNLTSFTILTLPHPRNGAMVKYLWDDAEEKLYELFESNRCPFTSIFVDNFVEPRGCVYYAAPFDISFLALHLLCSGPQDKFLAPDDILSRAPCCASIPRALGQQLHSSFPFIAASKNLDSLLYFRYCKDVAKDFFQSKFLALQQTMSSARADQTETKTHGFRILLHYIPETLHAYLSEVCDVPLSSLGGKQKSSTTHWDETPKQSREAPVNKEKKCRTEAKSSVKPPPKGTPTITSMFAKIANRKP